LILMSSTDERTSEPGERGNRLYPPLLTSADVRQRSQTKARQVAIDYATMGDYYEGSINRRWRTDTNMLNDDSRCPIIWVNTAIGVVYDCFSALHTDNDDYFPELEVDYCFFRDATMMNTTPRMDDVELEHFWAYRNSRGMARPTQRDRRLPQNHTSEGPQQDSSLGARCSLPMTEGQSRTLPDQLRKRSAVRCWVPEAASCLTTNALLMRAFTHGWWILVADTT
jgi:hypothetical protein